MLVPNDVRFGLANNALLGGEVRVRVVIKEQRKIKRRTTKPLMAILDISPL